MNLQDICNKNGGGKDEHGYGDFYEKYIEKFKITPDLKILELGVSHGNSLRIWKEYFPNAIQITGIDNKPQFFQGDKSSFNLIEMDLRNDAHFKSFANSSDYFDLIIDDAGHHVKDTTKTFEVLFDKLRTGGVMILEDLHTNWLPNANNQNTRTTYELVCSLRDGLPFQNSFISYDRFKVLADQVSEAHVWARRTGLGEKIGSANPDIGNSYTIKDSVTSVIIKK